MPAAPDLRDTILAAWGTNNRVTVFLVENLPFPLWGASVPGAPRRTVRMIAGHIHNARCMWIKMVGKEHGIRVPDSVDRRKVTRKELVSALKRSSAGINGLLRLACDRGGSIPIPSTYAWRNPSPWTLATFSRISSRMKANHRGQIVLLARQLGHRLPVSTTGGLWQWTKRAREATSLRERS
jgi:hypothetical protein